MIKCDCCRKELQQINPPYVSKCGDTVCYRCDRFYIYTEQPEITKDNYLEKYLYVEGKQDVLYVCPPVDTRKDCSTFLGFGGSWWKIELFDGTVHYTNNVWCTIDVKNTPAKFKGKIIPNIKSMSSHTDYRIEALKALGWYEDKDQSVKGKFDANPVNLDWDEDSLPF
jgi:hypothetical protein